MGSEGQTYVEPAQLLTSWRVSWFLFLLQLAVLVFLILDVFVLRYDRTTTSQLVVQRITSATATSRFVELQPVGEATARNEPAELLSVGEATTATNEPAELQLIGEATATNEVAELQPVGEAATATNKPELQPPVGEATATNAPSELQPPVSEATATNEPAELQRVVAATAAAVGPMVESSEMDERIADRLRYPGRKRVSGFVGVLTGFGRSGTRRALLRETWFPGTPEEHARVEAATGLVFRFIVGHGSVEDEEMLQAENSTHGDFFRVDVQESYLNLNRKILLFFTTAFKLYEAKYYIKIDDDIFLMPERLSALIAKPRASPRTYLGCFKKGNVITDPKKRWFEPQAWLLGAEYHLYASGAIYLLSYDVVQILNSIPKGRMRMLVNEDASMGAWMLAFDVSHEKTPSLCQKRCSRSAVAIWDAQCSGICHIERRMKELHTNGACTGKGRV